MGTRADWLRRMVTGCSMAYSNRSPSLRSRTWAGVEEGAAATFSRAAPSDRALRILAFGAELDGDDKPRICGAAAQAFVATTQGDYRAFPGKGQLPDDLEAALPRGLPDAWNNKVPWSTQAFACTQP